MENSERLALPYIMPQQAQKHVTHNEAIRMLDALTQISVVSATLHSLPTNPQAGDTYIIPDHATGEWTGKEGQLACFQDGAWSYFVPRIGWVAWQQDVGKIIVFTDDEWRATDQFGLELQQRYLIGINSEATQERRLTVASNSTLFDHEGSDHRIAINKKEHSDTSSHIFQSDYTGHAEMGLVGNNSFSLKVSGDGAVWRTALSADPTNGIVSIENLETSNLINKPAELDIVQSIYVDPINGNDELSGESASLAVKTLEGVEKCIVYGRLLRIYVLGNLDFDRVLRFGGHVPRIEVYGRNPENTAFVKQRITVKEATNISNQIGSFWFRGASAVFLYNLTIDLEATKTRSFILFQSNSGFVRTNHVSVTRPETGKCTLYGDEQSFVAGYHDNFSVDVIAKSHVARGVTAGDNPNDFWCYPCNLTSF